jgi:hypothetical protein
MNKPHSRTGDRPKKQTPRCHPDEEIQYLLGAEEQILQSISMRAPLREVLAGICTALDCQIGNVVSFISLSGDDAGELAMIARNARLFGLFAFCSETVIAENDELLGSLEMYGCIARSPSVGESQLIERATCLAAIAIQREIKASRHDHVRDPEDPLVRGKLAMGPVYVN